MAVAEAAKDGPQQLTEEDLKAIVDAELEIAMGEDTGEIADERSTALDRFNGEPDGREMEGRSQVQARDIMEVVEWILPSLIRIFATQRALEIDPVGPEDEDQADQETDYLRHLFFKKMDGFLILYTWFKDALIQKNGIIKTSIVEETKETKETYNNLSQEELQMLLSDENVELIEHEQSEENVIDMMTGQPLPLFNVTAIHREDVKRIETVNIPPETFGISQEANSCFTKSARFTVHWSEPTISELLEEGYDWNDIKDMELGTNREHWTEEGIARRNKTDEQWLDQLSPMNYSMQTIRMAECYIHADMDNDGIGELLKVERSGDFIAWEEVDDDPFDVVTPVISPHKFFGTSVADLMMEIQNIRTGLWRAYMDNVHVSLQGKTYYDENTANLDDLLDARPWGLRAVDGSPGEAILEVAPQGLPAEMFSLEEWLDKMKRERIGDFQSQLDPTVLKEANNGVVLEMIQESKAKVEMIARIFAETGGKSYFRRLHKLARMNSDKDELIKLQNQWIPVNPASWRERTDFTVKIGLGTRSKQENMATAAARLERMDVVLQSPYGPMLVSPDKYYEAHLELEEATGEGNPGHFWANPAEYQPPPPPPDPQMEAIAATERVEGAKRQIDDMKLQNEQMVNNTKASVEQMKMQIAAMKESAASAREQDKVALERTIAGLEHQVDQMDLALKEQTNHVNVYKAELDSATKLTQTLMQGQMTSAENEADREQQSAEGDKDRKAQSKQQSGTQSAGSVEKAVAGIVDALQNIREQIDDMNSPKDIVWDDDDNIIQVGKRKITRDEKGRSVRIG